MEGPQKTKYRTTKGSSNPTLKHISRHFLTFTDSLPLAPLGRGSFLDFPSVRRPWQLGRAPVDILQDGPQVGSSDAFLTMRLGLCSLRRTTTEAKGLAHRRDRKPTRPPTPMLTLTPWLLRRQAGLATTPCCLGRRTTGETRYS